MSPPADPHDRDLGADLEAHPEGGRYRRIWASDLALPASALPAGYDGDRLAGTCIAYALAPGESSRWHRVRSTELWLWQGGGASACAPGAPGPRRPSRGRSCSVPARR